MSPVCFVTEVLSTLRGSAPIARRKGHPQSSALRLCRPAFGRLRFAPVGSPSLAPCYPRLRQVAFGMYMPRFNADVQKPEPKEEAPMKPTANTVTAISENPKQPQQRQTAKM